MYRRQFFRMLFTTATLLTVLLLSFISQKSASASDSYQDSDGLFQPLTSPAPALASAASIQARQGVIRSRFVAIRTNTLSSSTVSVKLNLFDDSVVTAVQDRLEQVAALPGSYTWIGHVSGKPYSDVVLTVTEDGIVAGHVHTGDALYEVSYAGNNVHSILQLDQSAVKDEHAHAHLPTAPNTPNAMQPMADSGSLIDVLVLYTTAARTAAGSVSAIQAQIASAVASANQAYVNSQINQRIRLVYMGEIAYTESGNQGTDLNRLTSSNDGYLDLAQKLRNMYRADIVSLITATNSNSGIAWQMDSMNHWFESYAYNVVGRNALAYPVLAHEMGHNMGDAHDTNNSCGANRSGCPGAFPYSYGYQEPSGAFRDIMAYPNGCNSPCPWINYFSNQVILYNGKAMGNANADLRTSMNNTAYTVANFRQSLKDTIGTYNRSTRTFYLRNSNTSGPADIMVTMPTWIGTASAYPVTGDWDGDGTDTVGIYDQATGVFSLYDSNSSGAPMTHQFVLGNPGDVPFSGRWVADAGHDGVGVHRPSNGIIYLVNTFPSQSQPIYSDYFIVLGNPGWKAMAGKWAIGALDTSAVYNPAVSRFYMTSASCDGVAPGPNTQCLQFSTNDTYFGPTNATPIRGDWAGLSQSGIGSYIPATGTFLLKNVFPTGSGTTSAADTSFVFSGPGEIPVTGHWTAGNVASAPSSITNVIQPAIIVTAPPADDHDHHATPAPGDHGSFD